MTIRSLEDLFLEELSHVYDAERQLSEALPNMAKNAKNEKLVAEFDMHLKETQEQMKRIEQLLDMCNFDLRDERCDAMKGLLKEVDQMIADIEDHSILDAALITAAQKVEHYEISSYGSLLALGKCLGIRQEALDLLRASMIEEKRADEKLSMLAEKGGINERALKEAA